jgi:DNA-binding transcriptional MocR family regulator
VELPKSIDTIELYNEAVSRKITFSPGSLFTLQKQFSNCMRLAYGLEWNERTEYGLKQLGRLAKGAI